MYSIIINLKSEVFCSKTIKTNADIYLEIGNFLSKKSFKKQTLGVFAGEFNVDLCTATTNFLELLILIPEIKQRASILKIQENGHSIDMSKKIQFLYNINA